MKWQSAHSLVTAPSPTTTESKGKKEFASCFSHLCLSGLPLQVWMNEICTHKHLKSQATNSPRRKKLTPRKHKNWVKLLTEEWKLRFEFIPKKTKHNSLSQHSKEKQNSGWKVLGSCLLQRRQENIIKEFMRLSILCSQDTSGSASELQAQLIYPQILHLTVHLLLCWIAAAFEGKQICHSFSKYKLLLKKMLYWNFRDRMDHSLPVLESHLDKQLLCE